MQPSRIINTLHLDGRLVFTCEYPHDVGNLHVIDYRLHQELDGVPAWPGVPAPAYLRSPADWSQP